MISWLAGVMVTRNSHCSGKCVSKLSRLLSWPAYTQKSRCDVFVEHASTSPSRLSKQPTRVASDASFISLSSRRLSFQSARSRVTGGRYMLRCFSVNRLLCLLHWTLIRAVVTGSNQIKFINIRQQIINSTHVKKKQSEQCEDIKERCRS